MALLNETIVPQPHIQVFTSFADLDPRFRGPRGCVEFNLASNSIPTGAIAAKATANQNVVEIDCVLPQNYAYALTYVSASIFFVDQEDADNYDTMAALINTFPSVGPGGNQSALIADGTQLSLNSLIIKTWRPTNKFSGLMLDRGGGAIISTFRFTDSDNGNATAAATMLFYACFLMYDITQALDVGVNASLPVRIT